MTAADFLACVLGLTVLAVLGIYEAITYSVSVFVRSFWTAKARVPTRVRFKFSRTTRLTR